MTAWFKKSQDRECPVLAFFVPASFHEGCRYSCSEKDAAQQKRLRMARHLTKVFCKERFTKEQKSGMIDIRNVMGAEK